MDIVPISSEVENGKVTRDITQFRSLMIAEMLNSIEAPSRPNLEKMAADLKCLYGCLYCSGNGSMATCTYMSTERREGNVSILKLARYTAKYLIRRLQLQPSASISLKN